MRTFTGLANGQTYTFKVRGVNSDSGKGTPASASVTLPSAAPDPMASVSVVHNGNSLAVTWPAAARAQTYHVTYSGDNAQSWSLGAASHSGIRLTISGVDSTKGYLVGVRARNALGYSNWRNSAYTPSPLPDAVSSVSVVHNGSSLSVTWPAAARAETYHVTYSGDSGQSWSLGASSHSDTSLTVSGVDSEKTYTVGVRAQNAAATAGGGTRRRLPAEGESARAGSRSAGAGGVPTGVSARHGNGQVRLRRDAITQQAAKARPGRPGPPDSPTTATVKSE